MIQAFISDITERKRAEAELLKALAREKELGQLKSNFVSMVSLEFRSPLGVILSSAEILESYFDRLEPVERREQLVSIQKNTRRMAELMEEVLLLGVVEAGKLDFNPSSLDLRVLCRRPIDEQLAATNQQCPIILRAQDLPEAASGDERLLRHIWGNLLSNAISVFLKACPLDCAWCHNPEGKSSQPQVMQGAAGQRTAGTWYTAEALARRLNRQAEILRASQGGVTFSGGEPLAQADFLLEVIDRVDGLHILLDAHLDLRRRGPSAAWLNAVTWCTLTSS